jgi:hypothetical protein
MTNAVGEVNTKMNVSVMAGSGVSVPRGVRVSVTVGEAVGIAAAVCVEAATPVCSTILLISAGSSGWRGGGGGQHRCACHDQHQDKRPGQQSSSAVGHDAGSQSKSEC